MPEEASLPTFVTLARLLRPQGRRGELLADLLTDTPELLTAPAGVFLVPAGRTAPAPSASRIIVESQWMPTGRNAGRVVIKLAGTDSISAAETLAGSALMLPAGERPPLDPDTFYISDLAGATLFNGEVPVGEVLDVEFATTPDGRQRLPDAPPLLVVHPAGAPTEAEPLLIPFTLAHLDRVDLANRRILMNLPDGLLDLIS